MVDITFFIAPTADMEIEHNEQMKMARLKYYEKEEDAYCKAYGFKLTDDLARLVVRKLCLHFMKLHESEICGCALRNPKVKFFGHRQSGYASYRGRICLSHNPSLGLVCHEVAHLVHRYNSKSTRHTKKLMRTVGRLIDYALKKKLWDENAFKIYELNAGSG